MRKMSYFVTLFLSFFVFSLCVFASEIAVITGYDVRFRSSMDTSSTSNILGTYNNGDEFLLIDAKAGSNSACSKWYKVKKDNVLGYICGEFATIKEVTEEVIDPADYQEYSEYLKELGFPDSYITALIKLHNAYPNWDFKPYKVNKKFNEMVNLEYNGHSEGWSLFEDIGGNYDGYKATDSWAYNYTTDVFRSNYEGGGVNRWYAPNKNTIGYYMDPRNFLNERQVFMFETLSYNESYHTKAGVELMLKGTFMTGKADDEHTFADAFIDAAKEYNVSPYVLVSRVIQEVGANGSTITSGTVSGYEGYYNFYNIGAYGNSNDETIKAGLKYAKSKGWNTKYKAIVGGAAFLADGYINAGQDTLYSQKWDIVGPDYVSHQYMQNIEAPASESIKTYRGYADIKLLNSNFVFLIPIYNEMPDKTSLPDRGNPNNYLKELVINDNILFKTASNKKSYDLILPFETKTLKITGKTVNGKAKVNGFGSKNFDGEKTTLTIKVTAENGVVRNYTINIIRDKEVVTPDPEPPVVKTINDILTELKINHKDGYITGNPVGTDIKKIAQMIKAKDSNITITSFDKTNKAKNSGKIASGDAIKIKYNKEEKTYKIIVYGDVNGDGVIAATDYVAIKNHIMETKKLNDFELLCADTNHDNKVLATDYVAIKNHIMEVKAIMQ